MMNPPATAVEMDPQDVAAQLAQEGAILSWNGRTLLVGHLIWLRDDRIFCFAANGTDPKRDGHLLMFDVATGEQSEVSFWRRHRVVARLTSLAAGQTEELDDFRAAWRVWQQRRPLCERLIGASLSYHSLGHRVIDSTSR